VNSKDLKVSQQCQLAYSKAYHILGLMNRCTKYKHLNILICLYKSLVRPHLEHCVAAYPPHFNEDKELREKYGVISQQVLSSSWHGRPFGQNRHRPKIGEAVVPFWGELGSHLTQCRLCRGLPPCQVSSWSELADLNRADFNHWFKSWLKSNDFLSKKSCEKKIMWFKSQLPWNLFTNSLC